MGGKLVCLVFKQIKQFYILMLPPVRPHASASHQSLKDKITLLNNHSSHKTINNYNPPARQRCSTEPKQSYIGKKIMNYMSFDRVKSLKNYTQMCQQNMQRFHQERKELKQMEGTRCYIEAQIKRNKTLLSPRGTTLKIYMKSDKQPALHEESAHKKSHYEKVKQRMRTQAISKEGKQSVELKARLKEERKQQEAVCLSIKKYSQMSIREIIQKDLALQPNKRVQLRVRRPSNRYEGW